MFSASHWGQGVNKISGKMLIQGLILKIIDNSALHQFKIE